MISLETNRNAYLSVCPLLRKMYGWAASHFIHELHNCIASGKGVNKNGKRWVYKTVEQWAEHLCVSASTIKRATSQLVRDGVIQVKKLDKHKYDQTNFYTLNTERLLEVEPLLSKALSKSATITSMISSTTPKNRRKSHRVKQENIHNPSVQCEPIIKISSNEDNNKIYKYKHSAPPLVKQGRKDNVSQPIPLQDDPEPISPLITPHNVPLSHGSTVSTPDAETVKPEKPKPTIVQDMLEIWNQEIAIPRGKPLARLDQKLCPLLVGAFKSKFGGDLEQFRKYCTLIKTSPYLMGEDFSLFLEWAITFKTIDRIRAGDLGVSKPKQSVVPPSSEDSARRAEEHIALVDESEKCKGMRRYWVRVFGAAAYMAWLAQVGIAETEDALIVPNQFVASYITQHYGLVLEQKMTIQVQTPVS